MDDGKNANPEKVVEDKFYTWLSLNVPTLQDTIPCVIVLENILSLVHIIIQRHLLIHSKSSVVTGHQLHIPSPGMEVESSEAKIYSLPR